MVLVELSWVAAAKKDLKETASLAQKQSCPWQQQPEGCSRILQSLEINKPARLPCTALTQRTAPDNFLGSLAKKICNLCSQALGRTEELCVPVPSLLEGLQVTCLHEPGLKHPSSSSAPPKGTVVILGRLV